MLSCTVCEKTQKRGTRKSYFRSSVRSLTLADTVCVRVYVSVRGDLW
jgi:hypothetical protein